MKPIEPPPGFIVLDVGKQCLLVLPERIYLAGLRLGKVLRRYAAEANRERKAVKLNGGGEI